MRNRVCLNGSGNQIPDSGYRYDTKHCDNQLTRVGLDHQAAFSVALN
jgi:hypothetical protein